MAASNVTQSKPAGGFLTEVAEFWRQLPDKWLFGLLTAVWALLFHFRGNTVFGWIDTPSLFEWMYFVFDTSDDDAHGKLIPFVVLALFWWKRQELMEVPKRIWWGAFGLIVVALLFHVIGFLVQQTRISILAFFLGWYGIMGLVWGVGWLKASFFPMILFLFCVPLGAVSEAVTFPLRLLVSAISVGFSSNVLGIDVVRDGSLIYERMGGFRYDVAPACSGIRSLISLLALTTIYAFVLFRSNWKKAVIVAAAFPLAVLGNVVRIVGVIIGGDLFGQEFGVMIEQKFGFVTFGVALVCLMLLGHWLREPESEPVETSLPGQTPETA